MKTENWKINKNKLKYIKESQYKNINLLQTWPILQRYSKHVVLGTLGMPH